MQATPKFVIDLFLRTNSDICLWWMYCYAHIFDHLAYNLLVGLDIYSLMASQMSVNIVIFFTWNIYNLLVPSWQLVLVIGTLPTLCKSQIGCHVFFISIFCQWIWTWTEQVFCARKFIPSFFFFNSSQPMWHFIWCLACSMSYICKCSYATLSDSTCHIQEEHLECLPIFIPLILHWEWCCFL